MNSENTRHAVNRIVARLAAAKNVDGVALHLESPSRGYSSSHLFGSFSERDHPYYIASINKMMIAALAVSHFKDPVQMSARRVQDFFPTGYLNRFLFQGNERALESLTVWHLMTHSSGLPCYLLDREKGEKPLMKKLMEGYDEPISFDRVMERVARLKPKFLPGAAGRAYYANTNFRLLARILEIDTGKDIRELLTEFMEQSGMNHSFVVTEQTKDLLPIGVGRRSLLPLQFLSSTHYDIFSTAGDQMIFLKQFFSGHFFDKGHLPALYQWRKIFFPMQYGAGLQRFSVPRILSPFHEPPVLIGHAGSTGALCFYSEKKDLYITGAISQSHKVAAAFRSMMAIATKFPNGNA